MNQGPDSSSTGSQPSPYERLGIETGASFEAVQAAKQARLEEVGENPQARAQVEAAYDAVLMDRLKERQQGKVSTAALNASAREAKAPAAAAAARPSLPSLPKLPALPKASLPSTSFSLPSLELAEGQQRWLPLGGFAALTLLLLLTPASSAELVLALSTLFSVVLLQRRNRRFLQAVGFSVLLLSLGLGLGALLLQVSDPSLPLGLPLDAHQVQSLPALLLLLLGALLIA